jgi:hypothetical protein
MGARTISFKYTLTDLNAKYRDSLRNCRYIYEGLTLDYPRQQREECQVKSLNNKPIIVTRARASPITNGASSILTSQYINNNDLTLTLVERGALSFICGEGALC